MISITRSVAVCTIDSDISRIPNREREGITLGSCSLKNRLDHPLVEDKPRTSGTATRVHTSLK